MMAHCPVCEAAERESLQGASQVVVRVKNLSPHEPAEKYEYRVKIDVHPDGAGGLCLGGGRLV